MNTKVNIAGVEFKNPVTTASGTFGSGMEYGEFVDLNRLGAVTTKGVANVPWEGNPTPRIAETYGGMLNAIGLQNPGIDVFVGRDIPYLKQFDTKIIVNVCGRSEQDYCEVVERLADQPVDMTEFNRMLNELNTAKSLVYLADNAGELVMDKLLISEIKKAYPDLDVTLAVRGYPVLNDATLEDCRQVGIDKIANAMSNGSHVAGTYIPDISAELREKLLSADVIISKGQGNFETLSGSGLNIYYVFLCKCQLFCRIFDVPQLTGMLLNERRIKID